MVRIARIQVAQDNRQSCGSVGVGSRFVGQSSGRIDSWLRCKRQIAAGDQRGEDEVRRLDELASLELDRRRQYNEIKELEDMLNGARIVESAAGVS